MKRPGIFAWAALVIGVVAYDAACPPGHTMSEEVDRWLDTSPVVVWVVLGLVAAHLLTLAQLLACRADGLMDRCVRRAGQRDGERGRGPQSVASSLGGGPTCGGS